MSKTILFCLNIALRLGWVTLALAVCLPVTAQQPSPDWIRCVNLGNAYSPTSGLTAARRYSGLAATRPPIAPSPTPAEVTRTGPRATMTAASPTTARPSGSIRTSPASTITGVSRTATRRTTTAPSPTSTWSSGSIRGTPKPTTTGAYVRGVGPARGGGCRIPAGAFDHPQLSKRQRGAEAARRDTLGARETASNQPHTPPIVLKVLPSAGTASA